jgi:hypothetical protein
MLSALCVNRARSNFLAPPSSLSCSYLPYLGQLSPHILLPASHSSPTPKVPPSSRNLSTIPTKRHTVAATAITTGFAPLLGSRCGRYPFGKLRRAQGEYARSTHCDPIEVVVSLVETLVKFPIACALLRYPQKRIWVERHERGRQEEVALLLGGRKWAGFWQLVISH